MGSITYFGMSFSKRNFLSRSVVTARKHSLPRLCFYRCMSVYSGKGRAWQGGMHGWGACMVGGVCGRGGMHGWGACMAGGVYATHAPPHTHTTRYSRSMRGDTHPTGMHSCLQLKSISILVRDRRVGFHMVLPQQVPFGGGGEKGTCNLSKT